jgi:hypothetical protein
MKPAGLNETGPAENWGYSPTIALNVAWSRVVPARNALSYRGVESVPVGLLVTGRPQKSFFAPASAGKNLS